MRKTLVDRLSQRVAGLDGDLVLELEVACGRDTMERRLAQAGQQLQLPTPVEADDARPVHP